MLIELDNLTYEYEDIVSGDAFMLNKCLTKKIVCLLRAFSGN